MILKEFFDEWNGKACDYDNYAGDQCVDLYDYYCRDVINCPVILIPSAKDIWNDYPIGYFERIINTPDAIPIAGDIIIWGGGIGEDGHVAIFKEGNVDSFISFDENFPFGSKCHFQEHNYNYVLGWLHPLVNPTTNQLTMIINQDVFKELVGKSTKYDEFIAGGYDTYQKIRDTIEGYQSRITTLEGKLATAEGNLINKISELSRVEGELLSEKKLHETDTIALASMNKTLDEVRQSYQGRITELQTQVTGLAKEKGALVIELAQLKATTKEKYSFKLLGLTIKIF